MKITCISDTHGHHTKLDLTKFPADVLVHAGDWTKGRDTYLGETAEFLAWFDLQPFKHKILIAGNHEVQVQRMQELFRELLLQYPGITYLQNEAAIIDGINFYGSPYSNVFYDWAFMEEEPALERIWAKIPFETDVLITHGPAYGDHDHVKHAYERDPNVGSASLAKIKRVHYSPLKVHISGHIHEAYGTSGTKIKNVCPSILNERYQFVNDPIVITI